MRLTLVLLLVALPARAEPSYWTRVLEPEKARALRLVREGHAQLSPALTLPLPRELAPQQALEGARARFALAKQLDPSLRAARLANADTLALREDDASRRAAVDELHALRELDPLYEAERVAFELGLLHARGRELDAARAEYDRALALHSDQRSQAPVLLELAGVVMWQGDLTRALALYERAAHEGDANDRARALWGSAVALDRLGDPRAAMAAARRALASDRAPFAALQRARFVPDYERDYYQALGQLALGELEPNQRDHRTQALRSFDRYLTADGGQGPFAEHAREHILELTKP